MDITKIDLQDLLDTLAHEKSNSGSQKEDSKELSQADIDKLIKERLKNKNSHD